MTTYIQARQIRTLRQIFLGEVFALLNNPENDLSNEERKLLKDQFEEISATKGSLSEQVLTSLPLQVTLILTPFKEKFQDWLTYNTLSKNFYNGVFNILEGPLEEHRSKGGSNYKTLISKTTSEDLSEGALHTGRPDKFRIKYMPR